VRTLNGWRRLRRRKNEIQKWKMGLSSPGKERDLGVSREGWKRKINNLFCGEVSDRKVEMHRPCGTHCSVGG